jgi:hypothetical protein
MYVNNVDIACSTSVDSGACLINHIKKAHLNVQMQIVAKEIQHTLYMCIRIYFSLFDT